MARHFVRLKLTLLAAALRLNWQQLLGFVVSIVAVFPLAIGGFFLLWWLGGETAGGSGMRLAFAVLAVLWVIGPPLVFGLDETLDPARLRLLPLTPRQLATGLLAASAVGVGPVGTFIALSGAVVGFAPPSLGAVIVVAAVLAHFVLCLVLGRTVTTLLSRWLRSRRGKDVLVLGGAVVGISFAGLGQVPNLLFNVVEDYAAFAGLLERIETIVGVTPFAWAGSAVMAASQGRPLSAAAWLAATVILVIVLTGIWVRALSSAVEPTSPVAEGTDRELFSGPSALLPRTRLGAAAARELRYQWRLPQLRAQWIFIPLMGIGLVVGGYFVPGGASQLLVFGVCGLVAFHGFGAVNAFGGDRGAVWTLVAASGIERADLAGKNAAGALVLLPFAAVLALALAAVTGGWIYVPTAVLGAVTVLSVAYGIGNVVSVLVPAPLPEAAGNIWATSSGAGCAAGLAQALAMLVGTALVAPAAAGIVVVVAFAPAWLVPIGIAAAGYGLALWWLGLTLATRFAEGRGPEIITALSANR